MFTSKPWSERSHVEKCQFTFAVIGLGVATFAALGFDSLLRYALMFAGMLVGAGVGFVIGQMTDRTI